MSYLEYAGPAPKPPARIKRKPRRPALFVSSILFGSISGAIALVRLADALSFVPGDQLNHAPAFFAGAGYVQSSAIFRYDFTCVVEVLTATLFFLIGAAIGPSRIDVSLSWVHFAGTLQLAAEVLWILSVSRVYATAIASSHSQYSAPEDWLIFWIAGFAFLCRFLFAIYAMTAESIG